MPVLTREVVVDTNPDAWAEQYAQAKRLGYEIAIADPNSYVSSIDLTNVNVMRRTSDLASAAILIDFGDISDGAFMIPEELKEDQVEDWMVGRTIGQLIEWQAL